MGYFVKVLPLMTLRKVCAFRRPQHSVEAVTKRTFKTTLSMLQL
jgi:hypothetical protein